MKRLTSRNRTRAEKIMASEINKVGEILYGTDAGYIVTVPMKMKVAELLSMLRNALAEAEYNVVAYKSDPKCMRTFRVADDNPDNWWDGIHVSASISRYNSVPGKKCMCVDIEHSF